MPKKINVKASASEAALNLVAKKSWSETQLKSRLFRLGYSQTEIETAVKLLVGYGYINDRAIAEGICNKAAEAGRGPLWVRQTLQRRGLNEELIAEAEAKASSVAEASARKLFMGKFGLAKSLTFADKKRAFRYLHSRGFSPDCIFLVVGEPTE